MNNLVRAPPRLSTDMASSRLAASAFISMYCHNFLVINSLFLESVFSRRFSREKCPTLTVAVFLLFFSSDHRLHSRSHVLVSTRLMVNPAVTGSSPCFSQKQFFSELGDSFNFFGTVRLFFEFFCRRNTMDVKKSQRVPPFTIFGTVCNTVQKSQF